MESASDLRQIVDHFGLLIVDGGLATELEQRGVDISGPLWSAKALIHNPDAIEKLHDDYAVAGADVLISATYQASLAGFMKEGINEEEARRLISSAVDIAFKVAVRRERVTAFDWMRLPLCAASVGPYGATLSDGSEYHGKYGIRRKALAAFHRERLRLLSQTSADLFACETIPSLEEAEVLAETLGEYPKVGAWISFSCKDDTHNCHGESIEKCARILEAARTVFAVGVNCTSPEHIEGLIHRMRAATTKPIVVYPNSGETWNARLRHWTGHGHADDFAKLAQRWRAAGASLIGGCCRTGPGHIAALRQALLS